MGTSARRRAVSSRRRRAPRRPFYKTSRGLDDAARLTESLAADLRAGLRFCGRPGRAARPTLFPPCPGTVRATLCIKKEEYHATRRRLSGKVREPARRLQGRERHG